MCQSFEPASAQSMGFIYSLCCFVIVKLLVWQAVTKILISWIDEGTSVAVENLWNSWLLIKNRSFKFNVLWSVEPFLVLYICSEYLWRHQQRSMIVWGEGSGLHRFRILVRQLSFENSALFVGESNGQFFNFLISVKLNPLSFIRPEDICSHQHFSLDEKNTHRDFIRQHSAQFQTNIFTLIFRSFWAKPKALKIVIIDLLSNLFA